MWSLVQSPVFTVLKELVGCKQNGAWTQPLGVLPQKNLEFWISFILVHFRDEVPTLLKYRPCQRCHDT